MKKKVFVGLSGGVDSAVCALLLKNQGYDVTGVFLKNWSGDDYGIGNQCPWEEDLASARSVATFLDIPLKVYNFEKEYRELVIKDFFYQYSIGNTPNPDVLCNKFIKFDQFLKKALSEGADYIATGHYAKTENSKLYKAKDTNKDQTYFLYQLSSDQLSHSLFPLANLTKPEIRVIAKENNLPNAQRKDSQGICFIGKVDIVEFLKNELKEKKGNIVDIDTKMVVGEHIGVWFYTIGQRKGIKVGGLDLPYYVCTKDVKNNILYVASGKDNKNFWKTEMEIEDFHIINPDENMTAYINNLSNSEQLTAMIRYRGKDMKIKVTLNYTPNSIAQNQEELEKKSFITAKIMFSTPQWAPAIGQSIVVFKEGTECIGGGNISKIY